MADRILTVNAYTTFDFLSAQVEGHGFDAKAPAVLNVTTDRTDPDRVRLELELDNTEVEELAAHAETVELTADQARELAEELHEHADRLE
ncbi:DUF6360 family protein [Halorhabdus amylolytica]|uniref:DUF6360 family protein n=1 Tax=Halorhabdus amylolytica TaxID=2559573 RepID=UPI0010AB4F08|nr:DUF6360 family protein [Halorhabdus amylolytica]